MNKELTPEEKFLETEFKMPDHIRVDGFNSLAGKIIWTQDQVIWLLKEYATKAVEEDRKNRKCNHNFNKSVIFKNAKVCSKCGYTI